MPLGRRELLRASGAAAVTSLLPACEPPPPPPSGRFAWGVASGDPTPRSVILWTRLAVSEAETLEVELFDDPEARRLVTTASATAEPSRDGCVKLDVEGLAPGHVYYYRFRALDGVSPMGRTRTLPEGPLAQVRLGVVSCSNYAAGFFHVYRHLADRPDLWAIVHLGDTIYEYADGEYGALRALDPPGLCLSLEDYRRRHARYRTDLDAQAALRQHPLLAVWDDHEFANNASRDGAPGHDPVTMGPWSDRVAAARRAFFEWMPVRDETRVHRALVLGDLARLILLDTRMDERDPAPLDVADWNREDRRIVSDAQERWLVDLLSESDVRYTLVGNQVLLAPFPAMNNVDAWDGYPAQRGRVLGAIEASPAPVVVLTGDTHSSYAFDLPGPGYDAATQRGAIGVEWGASAISSPTLASDPREAERVLLAGTPHLRFTEQEHRGFVLLDLRPARARAELWLIDDVTTPDAAPPRLVRAFETTAADRACREVDATPSRLDGAAPPPAP